MIFAPDFIQGFLSRKLKFLGMSIIKTDIGGQLFCRWLLAKDLGVFMVFNSLKSLTCVDNNFKHTLFL